MRYVFHYFIEEIGSGIPKWWFGKGGLRLKIWLLFWYQFVRFLGCTLPETNIAMVNPQSLSIFLWYSPGKMGISIAMCVYWRVKILVGRVRVQDGQSSQSEFLRLNHETFLGDWRWNLMIFVKHRSPFAGFPIFHCIFFRCVCVCILMLILFRNRACVGMRSETTRNMQWSPLPGEDYLTHRIHGTGIFTYMKTIKINQMLANIKVTWILWVIE